jgi:WD40 repeat protein
MTGGTRLAASLGIPDSRASKSEGGKLPLILGLAGGGGLLVILAMVVVIVLVVSRDDGAPVAQGDRPPLPVGGAQPPAEVAPNPPAERIPIAPPADEVPNLPPAGQGNPAPPPPAPAAIPPPPPGEIEFLEEITWPALKERLKTMQSKADQGTIDFTPSGQGARTVHRVTHTDPATGLVVVETSVRTTDSDPTDDGGLLVREASRSSNYEFFWESQGYAGCFSGGGRFGPWTRCHPNGRLRVRGAYQRGVNDSEGGPQVAEQRHGAFVIYDEQGTWRWWGTYDDGKLVAAMKNDAEPGKEDEIVLFTSANSVHRCEFSPDGSILATVGTRSTPLGPSVELFDAATGMSRPSIFTGGAIAQLLFSPDSKTLFTVSRDGTNYQYELWNAADGKRLAEIPAKFGLRSDVDVVMGHVTYSAGAAYSPRGTWFGAIVQGEHGETVRVWDARTGQLQYSLPDVEDNAGTDSGEAVIHYTSLAFSPDEGLLLAGCRDSLRLFAAATGELKSKLPSGAEVGDALAFSPDGRFIYVRRAGNEERGPTRHEVVASGWEWLGGVRSVENLAEFRGDGLSPDGTRLVELFGPTDSGYGGISDLFVWNALTGGLEYQNKSPKDGVVVLTKGIILSTDWRFFAAIKRQDDQYVTDVHSLTTGEWLRSLPGASGIIFSPKGDLAAVTASTKPNEMQLVNLFAQESTALAGLGIDEFGRPSMILAAAFSPDGRSLAMAGANGCVQIFDVSKSAAANPQPDPSNRPPKIDSIAAASDEFLAGTDAQIKITASDPDGDPILYAYRTDPNAPWEYDGDGTCRLRMPSGGALAVEVRVLDGRGGFSDTARQEFAVASNPYTDWAEIWTHVVDQGEQTQTHRQALFGEQAGRMFARGEVLSLWSQVTFDPKGTILLGYGRYLELWALTGKPSYAAIDSQISSDCRGDYSPDGKNFALAMNGDRVFVWDTTNGKVRQFQAARETGESAYRVRYSPDGSLLAVGGRMKTIRLFDAKSGKEVRQIPTDGTETWDLAFSADGATLVADTAVIGGSKLTFRRVSDGAETGTIAHENDYVRRLAWTHDESRVYTLAWGAVRGFSVPQGAPLLSLTAGSNEQFSAMALSPDGTALAYGTDDGRVLLVRTADGRVIRPLGKHQGRVTGLAFRPDGGLLASVSGGSSQENVDHSIRLWGPTTEGEKLNPPYGEPKGRRP